MSDRSSIISDREVINIENKNIIDAGRPKNKKL